MNMEYHTKRLILKILPPHALSEVLNFQIRNRELFEQYEPTRPENFYSISYQKSLLTCEYNLAIKLSSVRFYVFLQDDPHTIIGTICLHNIKRGAYCCCEIGYKFDSAYHRQGYAREAMTKILCISFFELDLHRVFARVMPDNFPSINLLKSLGFEQEGLERECIEIQGKWTDHLRFSLICPSI